MIHVIVRERDAAAQATEPITSGSVGLECSFRFSEDWDGLGKTAIFRGGGQSVDVFLETDSCAVPHEVLQEAVGHLKIGVYGTGEEGQRVTPTVWADAGRILPGAEPSQIEPTPATQSLVQQILEAAENAAEIAQSVRDDADAGAFDGATGPRGEKGDPGESVQEVFWATYNETTEAEVTAAVAAGKAVILREEDELFYLTKKAAMGPSGTAWIFVSVRTNGGDADFRWTFVSGEYWNNFGSFKPRYSASEVGAYAKPSDGIPNSDLAEDAQRGYTREEKATVFPEQTVTFEYYEPLSFGDPLQLDQSIIGTAPADSIVVTFDGETYEIPLYTGEQDVSFAIYGDDDDEDFTDFPVHVYIYTEDGVIAANGADYDHASIILVYGDMTSGQHTFSAYFIRQPVTTTPDFDAAVAKSSAEALAEKLDTDGDAYRAASIPMGHLDSGSTATVMTATIPGITELRDGVCVWLTNGVINSVSGVTLNINGLGAKPIYNSLAGTVVTTTFAKAATYLFVYNYTRVSGGCWDMVYGYDTNTTYTPPKLGFGYAVCSTAATVAKTVAISSFERKEGGIVAIKFTNDVHAGATLNVNNGGARAIYYKGAAITAGVIKAGDTVTMVYSTYYHVLSIDRWGSDIEDLKDQLDSLIVADNVGY